MHEFSTMQSIVDIAIEEAEKHGLKEVNEVEICIGELTMLSPEQLRFCFDILKRGVLKKAKLKIEIIKSRVKCRECGYEGEIDYLDEVDHLFPLLFCPKCKGEIEIINGKECYIKKLSGEK